MVAMVIDTLGVRLAATAADMRGHVQGGRFFWLDVFGGDEATRTELLQEMGLDSPEIAWALRFGQSGRMYIGRDKLRVVTWMADPTGDVHEVHVFSGPNGIMTIWHGDATALSEIRQQFGERVAGLENSPYGAVGILLQLLAGTLDHTLHGLDLALDELRARLDKDPSAAEFALVFQRLRKLQSIMSSFNRFSSAVRSAIVGIEAVPGMDACGAEEFNEYAEQVEDVEHQIHERRRWLSDIMHDSTTAIAQRQGEQISRLTLVSLIFLPLTAISGFFGMNFNWMINRIESSEAFLVFGIVLPALSVMISFIWIWHRGLIQLSFGGRTALHRTPVFDEISWPTRPPAQTGTGALAAEPGPPTAPLSIRQPDEAHA